MQKTKTKIKVVLTGGHAATPALGTVEALHKRKHDWNLYWIGPISAMESQNVKTAAETILSDFHVKIIKIVAGRALRKGKILKRLQAYIKVPFGFIHAFWWIARIKPDIVVSFGGFAALPVVFSAWLFDIPVIIHEQIAGAGLANKLSAPFANKIAISRPESLEFFPKSKTILTGNPQVGKMFKIAKKTKLSNPPVLFITGGSAGAKVLNDTVEEILSELLTVFEVIHQVGENNLVHYQKIKNSLNPNLKTRYTVYGYVNPFEQADFFEKADMVLSRSGANTVADILATFRPAILIPIPWSIGDEQKKNALVAQKTGLARIVEEKDLSSKKLLSEILNLRNNWTHIVSSAKVENKNLNQNASDVMVNMIEELVV